MYIMQTEQIERLKDFSQEKRQQLQNQAERSQKEIRKLKAQARRLRRVQQAEMKQRQKLLAQIVQASKEQGQIILQRGGEQLRSGQQKAVAYGTNLTQGMSQTTQNLTNWGEDASDRLLRQGQQVGQNASAWGDDAVHNLRKQGRQLAQNTSDLGDEAFYYLRKQKRELSQNMADWGDEMAHRLRKQGRSLVRNLASRKEEAAHQLQLQKRDLGRSFAERKEGTTRQFRRQGRELSRNLSEKRKSAAQQLRKQRDALSERGEQLLGQTGQSTFWSILGFVCGLLIAGGVTYWLLNRSVRNRRSQEEEGIELPVNEALNNVSQSSTGRTHTPAQGGSALATKPVTSAEPTTRFVGVLSSREYYPIERKPKARDLVYFENEEEAQAEGFVAAY
jgi:hypothetical protein